MVFFAENLSFRMASCCSLLVINGGDGFLFTVFFCIFSTINFSSDSSSMITFDVFSSGILIFPPFFLTSFAVNGGGELSSRWAVIDQYSSVSKAWMARSLSQMIRTVTD